MDRTFYAEPAAGGTPTPGVVIAMHLWGVDADMRATAERFSAAGFAAIVPDLYAQFEGAPGADGATDYTQFLPFAKRLEPEHVDAALRSAHARLLRRCDGGIAIAGFCMGGAIALSRTSREYADIFSAAAVWYGQIRVDAQNVAIPLAGSFAAEDAGIPQETVAAFQSGLHVPNDIVVYPGVKHAFADASREAYDESAAESSWERSIAFLRHHLVR